MKRVCNHIKSNVLHIKILNMQKCKCLLQLYTICRFKIIIHFLRQRVRALSEAVPVDTDWTPQPQRMEESFTIHLGL